MEAQWHLFFRMLPRCCCNYRHYLTRCEGAGTNSSLRERRHGHVVRLDEEELPTAAFVFMNVTVLEELRDFGVVAVAPLVEHVEARTLGPSFAERQGFSWISARRPFLYFYDKALSYCNASGNSR